MLTTNPDRACIPSNYSRLIARELGLQPRELRKLLHGTGLTVNQLLQEDTLLSPIQQVQVLQNSLTLAGDEALGLQLGQRMTSPSHGAMGFLVNSSPDLLTALKAFQTFLPTRLNLAKLDLSIRNQRLTVTCSFNLALTASLQRLLSEAFAVIFFDTAEFIIGRPLHEAVLAFAHAEPAYSELYGRYLPCTVQFRSPVIALELPLPVCKVPNASANHENYQLALKQCQAMLDQLKASDSGYRARVQKAMLSTPPGALCEDEIAAQLFISKRTLARRLNAEGTSFRALRDQMLAQQAAGYLRDSPLAVEAIAELMNYHDSANFRRAFKRWFGVTPDEYRKRRSD
ncbi:AraC family transcriptional regulator [Marinobacter nauticus]|uniref:AraC family transcriptional regulator n=1 Tax=Marinobacter nauticus TaxID=2743 RepID=A0A368XG22_MARNT|nr:AraC family transcriptional regulator [Marinobacter nauticus]RCW65427.1 AraC family transcriptional regulator [Marinobacter nauticus]